MDDDSQELVHIREKPPSHHNDLKQTLQKELQIHSVKQLNRYILNFYKTTDLCSLYRIQVHFWKRQIENSLQHLLSLVETRTSRNVSLLRHHMIIAVPYFIVNWEAYSSSYDHCCMCFLSFVICAMLSMIDWERNTTQGTGFPYTKTNYFVYLLFSVHTCFKHKTNCFVHLLFSVHTLAVYTRTAYIENLPPQN